MAGTGRCFDLARRRRLIGFEERVIEGLDLRGVRGQSFLGRKWSSEFHVRETDGGVRHGQPGSQQHQRAPAGEEKIGKIQHV